MNIKVLVWAFQFLLGLAGKPPQEDKAVLVIEDDRYEYEMLRDYFLEQKVTTVWANSITIARDALMTRKFRLVLLDVNLRGGGDGIDFALEIKQHHRGTPIIFITGFPEELAHRLPAGLVWSYIKKGTIGGPMLEAIRGSLMISNGLNGHLSPGIALVATYVLCALSLFLGFFLKELAPIITKLFHLVQ